MIRVFSWPCLTLLLAAPVCRADYALRDGDTVVLLGERNTAACTYGKIVENSAAR